ncbi:MAG: product from transcript [Bradyrhizobium sp.]|nr:product from transcript [Bradyrhizobium sp.]
MSLAGKTLFVTGGSRGIGLAIGLRAARDGANVVIAAKTCSADPRLPGTIYSAADEIERAGGRALPVAMDLRREDEVAAAVDRAVQVFGGIDILVNNAGALYRAPTMETDMKRFDLLFEVNTRGTYMVTQKCIPHLRRAGNPHVLAIAPLLVLDPPERFAAAPAFAISKFNVSLMMMAFAAEFAADGIAFNTLWPRLSVWTAANSRFHGEANRPKARRPEIMGDAAWHILTRDSRGFTGRSTLDDDVLRDAGVLDFSPYYFEDADPSQMQQVLQISYGLHAV